VSRSSLPFTNVAAGDSSLVDASAKPPPEGGVREIAAAPDRLGDDLLEVTDPQSGLLAVCVLCVPQSEGDLRGRELLDHDVIGNLAGAVVAQHPTSVAPPREMPQKILEPLVDRDRAVLRLLGCGAGLRFDVDVRPGIGLEAFEVEAARDAAAVVGGASRS
jgi:hypothetical protein